MAPERLLKAPADEVLADVFSMGATAFEALTLGRRLDVVRDAPAAAVAAMLVRARPRAPRTVDPNLPASLEAVLLRALARSPRERHRSAGELADALEAALPLARLELGFVGTSRPHLLDARRPRADRRRVR
jgi:serine/threonine protein kinase